ncbi:MAG TPA: SprT family zinc-dependent metalloprotease [Candidatus Saccharimonadales bacterium]|nr:SprT family zinc-dependent metalloprotease [Candidatus Saccharimonadales bacterium]
MNFDIKVIKSPKRKTIALQIMPDASITVKIPLIFPTRKIEEFLKQHEIWIKKKQEEIRQRYGLISPKRFTTGEKFLYLGKRYPLTVSKNVSQAIVFDNGFFLNEFNHKNAETYFLNWYKKQALQLFTQRVANYTAQLKIEYQSISLSSATSKWGSCSHDNKLMFNWRLIMAPVEVIDSVIFHELAHIIEKNHTKRFWRKVTMWFPEYEKQKAWLDKNGHTLTI